jgi:aspartyl protease family protein
MPAHPLIAVSGMAAVILGAALALTPLPDGVPLPAPPGFSPPSSSAGNHTLTLHGDQSGQFWVNGFVNGVVAVKFIADTGASNTSFGLNDAKRLGLDPARLVFSGRSSTANGTIRTARARVQCLQIGPFVLRDVPVSIGEGDSPPLLGMDVLRRFRLVIGRDTLTISER